VARINRELPLTKSTVTGGTEGSSAKGKYETFQALVMQALQLRRTHREVFILCDIRGYSVTETASILQINEDSVLRRLAHARSEMGFDGEDGANAITEIVDI
jgi:DNA-directed RNA polymerase specialized sigma24 family protein